MTSRGSLFLFAAVAVYGSLHCDAQILPDTQAAVRQTPGRK